MSDTGLDLLPPSIARILRSWGISTLYPPQLEVASRGLVESGNFVLASPTASGKTLAAELPMLYELSRGGKVVYVVPLRAIASEKFKSFSERYSRLGFSVRMTVGDYDSSEEPLAVHDLIVTTYEKLDSIIRHSPTWLGEVALAVFDEIHYVADPDRGPTIEMTVTKMMDASPRARRVALSATISNIGDICRWLDAEGISLSWRPVPLKVGVYSGGEVLYEDLSEEEVRGPTGFPDVDLVLRAVRAGGQALVFYPTRREAVAGSERIAKALSSYSAPVDREALSRLSSRILSEGPRTPTLERLVRVVPDGAAFHHAGLSHGVRSLVEDAFRRGLLLAIAATPTLAAGVNLPARLVVVKSRTRYDPRLGRKVPISTMEFHQMAGRAGRPGYDEVGVAILVADRRDPSPEELLDMYSADMVEPVVSRLDDEAKLRAHVLSLVAMRERASQSEILATFDRTLASMQLGLRFIRSMVPKILRFLEDGGFVSTSGGRVQATALGRRVSQLYIDPASALLMVEALSSPRLRASSTREILHFLSLLPEMYRVPLRRRDLGIVEGVLEEMSPILEPEDLEDPSDYVRAVKMALVLRAWIEEAREAD
ncbi:MAG: hypothetical protein DRO06_00360, partial [Thermoproteota archaeon]